MIKRFREYEFETALAEKLARGYKLISKGVKTGYAHYGKDAKSYWAVLEK
jgi:hypothetical protein